MWKEEVTIWSTNTEFHGHVSTVLPGNHYGPLKRLSKYLGKRLSSIFARAIQQFARFLYHMNNKICEIHVLTRDIFFTAAAYCTYKGSARTTKLPNETVTSFVPSSMEIAEWTIVQPIRTLLLRSMHAAPHNWNDQSNTWEKEGVLTRPQIAMERFHTRKRRVYPCHTPLAAQG